MLTPAAFASAQFTASPGFTVSPVKVSVELRRGESYRNVFQVVNRSDGPLPLGILTRNFAAKDEEGNVVYSPDIFAEAISPESSATSYEAFTPYNPRAWLAIEHPDLLLDPGASRAVPYAIHVPREAPLGTYLVAAIFRSKFPGLSGAQSGAEILPGIGALFFIDVVPRVLETPAERGRIAISDFYIPPDETVRFHPFGASIVSALRLDRIRFSFIEEGPLSFVARVENASRFIARPQGTLRVRDMLGRQVGEVPFPSGAILPGAVRRYALVLPHTTVFGSLPFAPRFLRQSFLPGKYVGELAVRTDDGRLANRSIAFWAFPRAFVFGVLLPALLLVLLGIHYRRRLLAAARAFTRPGHL